MFLRNFAMIISISYPSFKIYSKMNLKICAETHHDIRTFKVDELFQIQLKMPHIWTIGPGQIIHACICNLK